MENELKNQIAEKNIELQNKKLESYSFHLQAKARSINLFYLSPQRRSKIEFHNKKYTVSDLSKEFSEVEILEELRNHPERFSPNVCLRPVYQSLLLPTVIFTGGGAEIAYWSQQVLLFSSLNVSFPILMLRKSIEILNSKLIKKINRVGIKIEKYNQNIESIKKDLLKN